MSNTHNNLADNTNWKPQSLGSATSDATSDVALPSVLTTHYCIPQDWQTVLHQNCSTKNPFDLRCESVTCVSGCVNSRFFAVLESLRMLDNHQRQARGDYVTFQSFYKQHRACNLSNGYQIWGYGWFKGWPMFFLIK